MKRLFAIVLIIALAFTLVSCSNQGTAVPQTSEAETATESEFIGEAEDENFKYAEYTDHYEITECKSHDGYITLPGSYNGKSITSFGQAFRGSLFLVTIIIPESYKAIETRAFSECYKLQNVEIRDGGIESIGIKAFFGCQAMRYISIPASVTEIAPDAFQYCTDLMIYGIPGSISEQIANNFNSIYFKNLGKPKDENLTSVEESSSSEESTAEETTN